ncbi:hypothetical protein CPC08DRAFT_814807 [Agrocybe pediades]|nr:hypothetical protein CPC08DRAFT_814807 [Agrocybe pediades]
MVCAECEDAIHVIPLDSTKTCPGRTGCPACIEASKLETQVVRAMDQLEKLLKKLSRQRQAVNYAHSSIIQKMPVEIMSKIFTFVVNRGLVAPRREELQHHTLPISMRLGHVCRAWRSVAWSTPSVWTYLTVALELSYTPTRVQFVYEFLSRAGVGTYGVVLSVYTQAEEFLPEDMDKYKPLLEQIADFGPICVILSVDMPEPLMRYFCSRLQDVSRVFMMNAFSRGQSSHFLTILHDDDRWKSLTELTLECISVEQCVKFLQSAPRLRTCNFWKVVRQRDISASDIGLTTHECLTSLTVRFLKEDLVSAYNPFSYLTLPHLTYLEYSIITPQSENLWNNGFVASGDDEFLDFLERSACPLDVLTLKGFGWGHEFMMSVFRAVPSIIQLGVLFRSGNGRKSTALDRLLRYLGSTGMIRKDSNGSFPDLMALPNLQHLEIYSEPSSSPRVPWSLVPACFGPASEFEEISSDYRRLQSLEVAGHPEEGKEKRYYIDDKTLYELIILRDAGARIDYWCFDEANRGCDYFAASMAYHSYDEDEESYEEDDESEVETC